MNESNNKVQLILKWWNIVIRVYFIFLLCFLVYTNNTHPELLAVVSERPPTALQDAMAINQAGVVYPQWMYSASTVSECKPMNFLYEFYKKWFEPFIALLAGYALFSLLLYLKEWMDKNKIEEDNENKTEPKKEM